MIINADARHIPLKGQTVQCVVSSPPYFQLRDYAVEGQIGSDCSLDEYVADLLVVFQEVKRVLRDDGSLWLNLGDSYSGSKTGGRNDVCRMYGQGNDALKARSARSVRTGHNSKNLLGIPWRVALALQADGWILRCDIIWAKANPMPESMKDRPTRSHEYLFLLTKSEQYFYDADAIKEPAKTRGLGLLRSTLSQTDQRISWLTPSILKRQRAGVDHRTAGTGFRNKRDVWTIPTRGYSGGHFAVFPEKLVEPCILAGSRPDDLILDPFLGTGSTAVVAERLGRRWMGLELNPDYCKLAQERIERARTKTIAQVMERPQPHQRSLWQ